MKRTATYLRVSSDKQATEGDSLAAQRDALRKYIDSRPDLVFCGEYMDDGVSGTKEDRDELQRMLADVKAGKVDLIIVTKLDRLYRSIRHYLNLQDTLDKCGVNWLAIWEPIYDTSTPQGRLIINQMMSIAQFEAENTGSRIRQVQAYKVQQGEVISGSTPPGYKIEGKKLVPNEYASNVLSVFEYYSLTGNLHETSRFCRDLPGLPKYLSPLKVMLQNKKYIGEHRGNPNFCTPIIPQDLFYDVQRKLKINVKRSATHTYIFTGLVKCGNCSRKMGGRYRIYHRQKGDVTVKFYACPKHFDSCLCDNPKMIREHLLEKYLIDHLKEELSGYIFTCEQEAKPAKDNSSRIASLERKISRLKDLYVDGLITLDEYKTDKEKYQNELDELKKAETQKPVDISKYQEILSLDLEKTYYDLTPEKRRYFWRAIVKEIIFDSNRNISIRFL